MTRYRAVLLALLAGIVLSMTGCSILFPVQPDVTQPAPSRTEVLPAATDAPTPAETENTEPDTEVPETTAAVPGFDPLPSGDTVLYFSNENENGLLYRAKKDGTEVTPVLDETAFMPIQTGEHLYFIDGQQNLIRFNLTTGVRDTLAGKAESFAVEEPFIVYNVNNAGSYVLYWQDLDSGTSGELGEPMSGKPYLKGGFAYYLVAGSSDSMVHLVAANLRDRSTQELARTELTFESLYPVPGGIYFKEGNEIVSTGYTWKFAHSNGNGVEELPSSIPGDATLLYVSEYSFLYTQPAGSNQYDREKLHRVSPSASDEVILIADNADGFIFRALSDASWLVKQNVGGKITYTYLDAANSAIVPIPVN